MEEKDNIQSELNPELFGMVKRGQLSAEKIVTLIEIRTTVNRFAGCNFVDDEKLEEIKSKFGVYPDLITWGDYFQTEIASQFFNKSDWEFKLIAETVQFDLISAHLIFSGKPDYFKDKVRGDALLSKSLEKEFMTVIDEENIHLDILLNYFESMQLDKKPISVPDRIWYESFHIHRAAV